MDDLLWLVNHPLWGNVVGILTSRNPDTPEGLESRLFVRIHRIPTELPHSTEPELRKHHLTWMDSGRASTLELLRWLSTSREVLRPLEPCLSLSLSTLQEWTWEHYRWLNLTLFTLSAEGSTMVFIGVRQCWGQRLGMWGPLVRSGGQVSSLHHLWALYTLSVASAGHVVKTVFGNAPTHGRPATPWLDWARAWCHVISSCHIVCDYALFWTWWRYAWILDHMVLFRHPMFPNW
jgi:hypothetical protein